MARHPRSPEADTLSRCFKAKSPGLRDRVVNFQVSHEGFFTLLCSLLCRHTRNTSNSRFLKFRSRQLATSFSTRTFLLPSLVTTQNCTVARDVVPVYSWQPIKTSIQCFRLEESARKYKIWKMIYYEHVLTSLAVCVCPFTTHQHPDRWFESADTVVTSGSSLIL